MATVDHGSLAHGGNELQEGGNEQGANEDAGRYAAGRPAEAFGDEALQAPAHWQDDADGDHGRAEHDHAAAELGA